MVSGQKSIFFSEEERKKIVNVCNEIGLNFSAFVRSSAIKEARKVLNENNFIVEEPKEVKELPLNNSQLKPVKTFSNLNHNVQKDKTVQSVAFLNGLLRQNG